MAPDGNGGVYSALERSGLLQSMQRHGVHCVDCYSVDNCLARVADPLFIGYCYSEGVDAGARVLSKAYPEEKVGVFAAENSRLRVIEYSELPPEKASATDPATNKLYFNWANICMHYFSVPWLQQVAA